MRIKKKTSSDERQILIGMIVNDSVCGRLASHWKSNLFKNKWANLVAKWCVNYFEKYNKAPNKHIKNLYSSWSSKAKSKDLVELVEKFLASLSGEYETLNEDINSEYLIDLAGKHFNKVRIEQLAEEIQGDIDGGDSDKAWERLTITKPVEIGIQEGIDILGDEEAWRDAFENKPEPLITFSGDLGLFFEDRLERDGLISFMAPEKRGKSFWLIEMAYKAMLQRKKVLFFDAGDMSRNQILRRLASRIALRPMRATTVKIPTRMKVVGGVPKVKFKTKTYKDNLSWQKVWKACEKVRTKKCKTTVPLFKVHCYPNGTLHLRMVEEIIKQHESEQWIPDVIVIDYADILNMNYNGVEGRDRIDMLWSHLRRISQMYHCLVITATQADADSYDKTTIGMKNFSNDKRKLAHVTGMIGLNMTDTEKDLDVIRLNWIVRREGFYSSRNCVFVAACRSLCRSAIVSAFPSKKET